MIRGIDTHGVSDRYGAVYLANERRKGMAALRAEVGGAGQHALT